LAENNAGGAEEDGSNNFAKLSVIIVLLKFEFEVKEFFGNPITRGKKAVNISPAGTSILKVFLFETVLSSATVFINKIKLKFVNVDFVSAINISRESGTFESSAVKIIKGTEIIRAGPAICAGYKIGI